MSAIPCITSAGSSSVLESCHCNASDACNGPLDHEAHPRGLRCWACPQGHDHRCNNSGSGWLRPCARGDAFCTIQVSLSPGQERNQPQKVQRGCASSLPNELSVPPNGSACARLKETSDGSPQFLCACATTACNTEHNFHFENASATKLTLQGDSLTGVSWLPQGNPEQSESPTGILGLTLRPDPDSKAVPDLHINILLRGHAHRQTEAHHIRVVVFAIIIYTI